MIILRFKGCFDALEPKKKPFQTYIQYYTIILHASIVFIDVLSLSIGQTSAPKVAKTVLVAPVGERALAEVVRSNWDAIAEDGIWFHGKKRRR